MNDLTRAAIGYLAEGHHLLALHGKRPNNVFHEEWSWDNSIHGLPESEEDEAALDAVFSHPTTTGVAILIPQHVLVADIDTEEAAYLFLALAGEMPRTRIARTPNGVHIWYWAPGADQSVWIGGRVLLFKGFGGYVAAPPSRHFAKDGTEDGVYAWIGGERDPYDPLPPAVERRIADERAIQKLQAPKTSEKDRRFLFVPTDKDGHWTRSGWAAFNVEGLLGAVRGAQPGNRNNVLAWAAMQAAEEGVPYVTAMPLLKDAALAAGLGEKESAVTIRAAFKRKARD